MPVVYVVDDFQNVVSAVKRELRHLFTTAPEMPERIADQPASVGHVDKPWSPGAIADAVHRQPSAQ